MKTPRIVVVGSVNVDMVVKSQRIPAPGETVTGGEFLMPAGGKGANQAVAAARLEADVTLVARVGDDMFGRQAVENFQREGIHTDCITADSTSSTGVALILVDAAGENSISVAPGANFELTPDDVDRASERITAADILMLQLEVPMPAVCRAAQLAAEASVPVILDPAPAAPLDESLLRHVSYLTPNETEAKGLTGVAVQDQDSARAAAEKLLETGVQCVLITLGDKGVLLATADRSVLIPSPTVEAKDSTAAGDAFNGGLAVALAGGQSIRQAVSQAALVGALSVTRLGAQSSLPTTEELRVFAETVGDQ